MKHADCLGGYVLQKKNFQDKYGLTTSTVLSVLYSAVHVWSYQVIIYLVLKNEEVSVLKIISSFL